MDFFELVFKTFMRSIPVLIPAFMAFLTRDRPLRWKDQGGIIFLMLFFSVPASFLIQPEYKAVLEAGEPVIRQVSEEGMVMAVGFVTSYLSFLISKILLAPSDQEVKMKRLWDRTHPSKDGVEN